MVEPSGFGMDFTDMLPVKVRKAGVRLTEKTQTMDDGSVRIQSYILSNRNAEILAEFSINSTVRFIRLRSYQYVTACEACNGNLHSV